MVLPMHLSSVLSAVCATVRVSMLVEARRDWINVAGAGKHVVLYHVIAKGRLGQADSRCEQLESVVRGVSLVLKVRCDLGHCEAKSRSQIDARREKERRSSAEERKHLQQEA